MNEKDLYKLFNHIKTDESEFDNIEEEISTMKKKRIMKNLNKKIKGKRNWNIIKYSSTAAALALVALIGINTVSPSFAENIPVIGSVVQALNEKMGIYGDYAEYSQIVDKTVTDKGIGVTVNEVIADGSRLIIGYTVKSNDKLEDDGSNLDLTSDFKINGKRIDGGGSAMGNYIDDYTYIGSETVNISLLKIPEEFKIDLKISNIMNTKGRWDFAFNASKEEITKNSTVFKPNQQIDFPDSIVTIDKVEFSPIGTYISLSGDYKVEPDEFDDSIFEYDYWLAYDDKGVELTSNGIGSGSSGGNEPKDFHSEMEYVKVDDIPKYLTIIPLKVTPTGGGGISFDSDGKETPFEIETKEAKEISEIIDGVYPKELPQGEFGKLVINDIATIGNTTTVTLTVEGKTPHFQAKRLNIKDDQGETIRFRNRAILRDCQNPNEFIIEFEALDPSEEYYLNTTDFANIEFDENMEFRIKLEK